MKSTSKVNSSRRKFLKNLAMAGAGIIIIPRHVLGGIGANGQKFIAANDRINLGFIGAGKQGKIMSKFFLDTNEINIAAVSDVYAAKADLFVKKVQEYFVKKPEASGNSGIDLYPDFKQILERKDIDAVVITTPDHWHAVMAVMAANAGKDIYCEKPMALTIKEGRAMVNATRKNNRVFQTGSMQRSWSEFRQAVELIRNGYIGEVKSVRVNIGKPPVAYNLAAETIPQGLDWKGWLGPNEFANFNSELAPPVNKDVYPNWRLYKEFGGGMVTDWGAHMFDIAQWALDMDATGPVKVIPPDDKDVKALTFYYANGIKMTHENWEWNNAVHFIGTEGEVKITRGKLETTPATLKDLVIKEEQRKVYFSENHYKDFLQAMRKRSKPICDVEIGHRTASVCNLANIAYELNRPLEWDPAKEKFVKDKMANMKLGRKLSNGWSIK